MTHNLCDIEDNILNPSLCIGKIIDSDGQEHIQ